MEQKEGSEASKEFTGWQWFVERAHGPHARFWLILFAFLEPFLLPLLPESLLVAMILAGRQHWKRYAAYTTLASVIGAAAGYCIGLALFHFLGAWVLADFGWRHSFHVVERMLSGAIFPVMLFVMFTPVPDKVFVLLAGFFHVPFFPFIAGYFIGRSARFFIVSYLVARFGEHVLPIVRRYFEYLALAVVLILLVIVLRFLHIIP